MPLCVVYFDPGRVPRAPFCNQEVEEPLRCYPYCSCGSTRDVNPSLSDDEGWGREAVGGGLAASVARPTRPAALEEHTSED